jgi:hypothetical protein
LTVFDDAALTAHAALCPAATVLTVGRLIDHRNRWVA